MVPSGHRPGLRFTATLGLAAAIALLASGCAKSADSGPAPGLAGAANGGQQQVADAGTSGAPCAAAQYGAPALDLTKATVGFSQSESTSNPFRGTETQSITDEAQKRASS